MKTKWTFKTAVVVLIAVCLVFTAGFHYPDVAASGLKKHRLISSLQMFPQRLQSLITGEAAEQSKALPLIETYSRAIELLKSEYYGAEVDEQELTYDAIRGMLTALGDPFTRFMDPEAYDKMREENEGHFSGIGAQLDTNKNGEIYIKEPLPDAPAIRAGVKANDVIIAVDDKPIANMDIENVVELIRGEIGTKVKLTFKRPGVTKPVDIVITRQQVEFIMVKSEMLDKKHKIGYVRLYQFNEQSDAQFDKALTTLEQQGMKGLILDLRGNPGGLLPMAIDIASRFIEDGVVVSIQERGGRKADLKVKQSQHNHKRYPLAVLVDKRSASASEIVSGAIKEHNAGTLVGVTTFGKGRVQTIMPMRDGSAVAITTAKYLTPNGIDIHEKGIEPDVEIEAREDFDPADKDTDVQLKKAVEVVKVEMGVLPRAVLNKTAQSAKAKSN